MTAMIKKTSLLLLSLLGLSLLVFASAMLFTSSGPCTPRQEVVEP